MVFQSEFPSKMNSHWVLVYGTGVWYPMRASWVSLVEKKKVFWVLLCDMSYMIKLFFCTSKVSIG